MIFSYTITEQWVGRCSGHHLAQKNISEQVQLDQPTQGLVGFYISPEREFAEPL